MTAYVLPESGVYQVKIGSRIFAFMAVIGGVGNVSVGWFEDQKDTGLVGITPFVASYDQESDFIAALAANGKGPYLAGLLPAAQAQLDELVAALPPETNSTPNTVRDFNATCAEFMAVIPPQPGHTAPQVVFSYQVPAGVTPYPSSETPAPPG